MTDTPFPPQHQDRQPGRQAPMRPEPDDRPRFPGSDRLAGKVALITGGDSGIGRAVSVLFAREGARLAIVYRDEREDAQATADRVAAEGSEALIMEGDIGDEALCRTALARTLERFGRLDILVNNAAEQTEQTRLEDISAEQLTRTFRTNVLGYFYMTKAALPHLEAGSAIINTTSVNAYRGSAHLMDYSSTRGASLALTRSLAVNLIDRGIRVNGVAPGPVWTPLIPSTFDDDQVARFGTQAPMGRAGQPWEIAPSFLFLACEDSSYMTGQVLHPNGGTIIGG